LLFVSYKMFTKMIIHKITSFVLDLKI